MIGHNGKKSMNSWFVCPPDPARTFKIRHRQFCRFGRHFLPEH